MTNSFSRRQRALAVALTAIVASTSGSVFAETYTMGYEALKQAIANVRISGLSYSTEFTDNDVPWDVEFTRGEDYAYTPSLVERADYLTIRIYGETITGCKFSTDYFKDKTISSITVDATMCRSSSVNIPSQEYSITIGGKTIASLTNDVYVASYINEALEPITFDINTTVDGTLAIALSTSKLSNFALKSIVIEYEESNAPEASIIETIPVGHAIELFADTDEEINFVYAINDGEWVAYSATNGIRFSKAGTYQLSYYATTADGSSSSEVYGETIEVVTPSGILAAQIAASEKSVDGFIISQGDDYVAIGETLTSEIDHCVAISSDIYSDLKTAPLGSTIQAVGRLTDKTSTTLPMLSSLTLLTINGKHTALPELTHTGEAKPTSEMRYNLKGQKLTDSSPIRRQITISKGKKSL